MAGDATSRAYARRHARFATIRRRLGASAPRLRRIVAKRVRAVTRDARSVAAVLARVATFAIDGVDPRPVWVEADIRPGLPAFRIVGLADTAVREARERVRAAILNSGFEFPPRRITVNLAPAYLRKVGPGLRPRARRRRSSRPAASLGRARSTAARSSASCR